MWISRSPFDERGKMVTSTPFRAQLLQLSLGYAQSGTVCHRFSLINTTLDALRFPY